MLVSVPNAGGANVCVHCYATEMRSPYHLIQPVSGILHWWALSYYTIMNDGKWTETENPINLTFAGPCESGNR